MMAQLLLEHQYVHLTTLYPPGPRLIISQTNGNVTQALAAAGLPLNVTNNPLFPVPTDSDPVSNAFNVTSRVTTNVEFRCLDQATAFSAVKHNLLKSVWFYEFNRSYQTPGFSPNFPRCEAPIDDEHPFGDTEKEYFK